MASLQKTYTGDLSQSIARRLSSIIASAGAEADQARKTYEVVEASMDQKGFLDPKDSPFYNNIDLPFGMRVTDGSIFRQALRHKLRPNPMGLFGERFQKKPFSPEMLTGQKRDLRPRSIINPKFTRNAAGAKAAGQPFPNVAVGSPLEYQRPITSGATPMLGNGGGGSSPIQQTRKAPAVEVKDPKLGKFFRAVARSLSASISGMSNKLDSNEESLITAKEGILGTVKKLEYNSDVLETKLDAIIDALRNQNRQQIVAEDNKEAARIKEKSDLQKQQYEGDKFQKQGEDDLEFMMRDAADERADDPETNMGGDGQSPDPWTPQLARGGIVDGPQSGYPAILHGREAVIPLDTPFTRQNYSAGTMGGNTSTTNNIMNDQRTEPSFEKFVPNMFNQIIESKVADMPEMKETTDMLGKIVEFPVKASGLIAFNVLGKALSGMRTLAGDVSGPLSTILSNLSSFGIANSVINSLTRDLSVGGAAVGRQEANKSYGQNLKQGARDEALIHSINHMATTIENTKGGEGGGGYRSGGMYAGGGGMYAGGGPGNVIEGAKNWWNRGRNLRVVNENTTRWFGKKGLIADDWKQRGKFGKGGKMGGWDITRGFRPGVPASEGGMMSGPTPAIRQAIERPLRAIRSLGSLKGGFMGLILNELMNPAPLADGTLTANMNAVNTSQFVNRNDTSDRMSNFINLQSLENQSSKINNFEAQQSKIIEINNQGDISTDSPEKPIEHIANNPNAIMDVYYPSPYNY